MSKPEGWKHRAKDENKKLINLLLPANARAMLIKHNNFAIFAMLLVELPIHLMQTGVPTPDLHGKSIANGGSHAIRKIQKRVFFASIARHQHNYGFGAAGNSKRFAVRCNASVNIGVQFFVNTLLLRSGRTCRNWDTLKSFSLVSTLGKSCPNKSIVTVS